MEQRPFGQTGLSTSVLGFGAGQIGDASLSEAQADRLLNSVLDAGITLLDTARGYGLSEERIGRHVAHRRDAFVLSTKVGYGVEGMPDWTYDTILAGIDAARLRMRTDLIDIVHLHSCPQGVLEHNGVLDALNEAKHQGKIRIAAYSGENDDLAWVIRSGRIGGVQTSVNVFDQRDVNGVLTEARAHGMGIIAKRSIANAPWRFDEQPHGHYCETYWHRMQTMNLTPDLPWLETALRFVVWHANVDCALVGTTNIVHLMQNIALVNKGPLPEDAVTDIRSAFRTHGALWDGQV